MKIKFKLSNFFGKSSKEVVKVQLFIKGLTAVLATSAFIQTNTTHAIVIAVAGYVLDGLASCLSFEKVKDDE